MFAPAVALLLPRRNIVKQPLAGIFFCVPLAIALWHPPVSWTSSSAIAIAATWLIAVYYLISLYLSSDASWASLNMLARRLREHDLREST
jgi:hypothetical protein